MRVRARVLHQPVRHLQPEVWHQLALQHHHHELLMFGGFGQSQWDLHRLSRRHPAHCRRLCLLTVRAQPATLQRRLRLPTGFRPQLSSSLHSLRQFAQRVPHQRFLLSVPQIDGVRRSERVQVPVGKSAAGQPLRESVQSGLDPGLQRKLLHLRSQPGYFQ